MVKTAMVRTRGASWLQLGFYIAAIIGSSWSGPIFAQEKTSEELARPGTLPSARQRQWSYVESDLVCDYKPSVELSSTGSIEIHSLIGLNDSFSCHCKKELWACKFTAEYVPDVPCPRGFDIQGVADPESRIGIRHCPIMESVRLPAGTVFITRLYFKSIDELTEDSQGECQDACSDAHNSQLEQDLGQAHCIKPIPVLLRGPIMCQELFLGDMQ